MHAWRITMSYPFIVLHPAAIALFKNGVSGGV